MARLVVCADHVQPQLERPGRFAWVSERLARCGASNRTDQRVSVPVVYAIVRAGGRQEKVSVGDVLTVDRLAGDQGSTVELTPLLLVDGETVTTGADALAQAKVTAEIVEAAKGPKIRILKFKNKTGYRKRQGHRAKLTRIKVTGITK
jgi:large subunit ribosomal protein L21